jgi:hypothetical protein
MTSGTDDTTAKIQPRPQMNLQPNINMVNRKISLKVMTLNNSKQKINDLLGNPIEIGIVVTWRVLNTARRSLS